MHTKPTLDLPIDALRGALLDQLAHTPVVVSAPTGSGKSTQIPRWLAKSGPVLVVQPRRVAARSLATRVAELEGSPQGQRVGYIVRGEARRSAATTITFVTTGIAMRLAADGHLSSYHAIVLDEFHERTLDLDLLLAHLLEHPGPRLVIMSATVAGDRLAAHIRGKHLAGNGRTFPVDIQYLDDSRLPPSADHLGHRIRSALAHADPEGDVLVFLPGKGEIRRVEADLAGIDAEVLPLHGGLSLAEQSRVFADSPRQRVILATNVAETSITLPRIRTVIDTGLVRRTRYHHGRGYLMLHPVARDSADQRAGRAGRVAAGRCIRLWGQHAELLTHTPPEIHRESLVPLVLGASVLGAKPEDLALVDPPRDWALADARADLLQLGALDAEHRLTERGRALFRLPLDASLGRLLLEAEKTDQLHAAIDLVAALQTPRPLFRGRPEDEEDDLRSNHCDVTGLIRAVREGRPGPHRLDRDALADARFRARQLREAWKLAPEAQPSWSRDALLTTVLRAWPDCAHLARRHGRRVGWSNGGTEKQVGRDSVLPEEAEACLVIDSRAFGDGRNLEQRITAATPVTRRWLFERGLGRPRLAATTVVNGEVVATIESVYAGRALGTREEIPSGDLAIEAVATLAERGSIFKKADFAGAWRRYTLHQALQGQALPEEDLHAILVAQVRATGLTRGDELALLSASDLLPPPLTQADREQLDRDFPAQLTLGTDRFRVEVDPHRRRVSLHNLGKRIKTPPQRGWLPAFRGFRVDLVDRGVVKRLR